MHLLKEVRESVDLTIAELAELTGVSTSTICAIERDPMHSTNYTVASTLAHTIYREVSDVFDMRYLTHLGRPACTGHPCSVNTTAYAFCPSCNIAMPVVGNCQYCDA